MSESSENFVPSAGVTPHLEPWQVISWTADQLLHMYTDWGAYSARKQNLKAARQYLDSALQLNPNCINALKRRSRIKRMQAQAPEAFNDCIRAKIISKRKNQSYFDPENNMEIWASVYESNLLEDAKRRLQNDLRLISTSQAEQVLNRLSVVNENMQDALSDETAPAIKRLINKMTFEMSKQPKYTKPECDVLSILENKEELLAPLEIERRKREYKIHNQRHLNKCSKDVLFLKSIRESPNLLLDQCVETSPYLKELTVNNYNTVRTFTKMLHTRCPKYSHKIIKFPNTELNLQHQQNNLFRIQFQTRRNMHKILRNIQHLICSKNLEKLSSYVEDVLGNYVTIKTNRIMPWKFEFINEVCNYLGLARINEYRIPTDLKVLTGRQRLLTLFKLPNELGNISSVQVGSFQYIKRDNLEKLKSENFKKRIARFEYRMKFAKYSIERSYLLHEAALVHLESHSFDSCCSLARKSMDEALKCNNYVWAVLSALTACKAHAILGKVEKQMELLTEAFRLAKLLKNIDLVLFIDICLKVNTDEIELKKALASSEGSIRKRQLRSCGSFFIESSPKRVSKFTIQ